MAKKKQHGSKQEVLPPFTRAEMETLRDDELLDRVHERVRLKLPRAVEDPDWEGFSREESLAELTLRWLDELFDENIATVFASNTPLDIEACRVSFAEVGLEKLWGSLDTALRFCAAHRLEAVVLHNYIYEEATSGLIEPDVEALEELFEPFQRDIEAHLGLSDSIVASYIRAHPDAFCDD